MTKGLFIWARLTRLTQLPGRILSTVHIEKLHPGRLRASSHEPGCPGLTWLPGWILSSVHMKNLILVDWDKIRKTNLTQERCVVRDFRSFVDSCKVSKKDTSHTSEVKNHARRNFATLAALLRKRSYFVKKVSSRLSGWSVHTGKYLAQLSRSRLDKPKSRQSSQPTLP